MAAPARKTFPEVKSAARLSVFIIPIFFLLCGHVQAENETPPALLLATAAGPEDPAYSKALTRTENQPFASERAKINYLIQRIRQSDYTFIRNGESFAGSRAATHLLWKFQRKGNGVKTAADFIMKIASRSSLTGQLYMIRMNDGRAYPVRDLLFNELRNLEEAQKQKPQLPLPV